MCLGSGFSCTLPFLAGVLACVCLCARSASTPPILAAVRSACVQVRALAFTRPILAGVLRCVCVCMRSNCTLPILARVRAAWFCVRVLPLTLPILAGVFGRLSVCVPSACGPPVLAGVRGPRVCDWVRVSAAPRQTWLGCWGVCVCVHALPVPRQFLLRFVMRVCRLRLYLSTCRSWLWCVRAVVSVCALSL